MHSFGAKVNHLTGLEEQLITLVPERQFLCKTSPEENFKNSRGVIIVFMHTDVNNFILEAVKLRMVTNKFVLQGKSEI